MQCDHVTVSRLHIIEHTLAVDERGIRQIAAVRVNAEIGRVHEVDVVHRLFDRIHKRRLHRLKAELHAAARRKQCRLREVARKRRTRLLCALVVVDIVACELNRPNSKLYCKVDGVRHDLYAPHLLRGIGTPKRIFSMSAETD